LVADIKSGLSLALLCTTNRFEELRVLDFRCACLLAQTSQLLPSFTSCIQRSQTLACAKLTRSFRASLHPTEFSGLRCLDT
jgi:hypothetical protein